MSYGSRCNNCGGEDCVCCEVYLEAMADERYEREYQGDFETEAGACDNCNKECTPDCPWY